MQHENNMMTFQEEQIDTEGHMLHNFIFLATEISVQGTQKIL